MINFKCANKFCCDDISLIENYDKALGDKTQTWDCHHILETDINMSRQQLIDIKRYYNVPASELIFLTRAEHNIIHKTGKHYTEESKQKMRISALNRQPNSEETRRKQSESQKERHKKYEHPMKGKHHTEESKQLMSEHHKGKHWRLENGKRIYYTL